VTETFLAGSLVERKARSQQRGGRRRIRKGRGGKNTPLGKGEGRDLGRGKELPVFKHQRKRKGKKNS